MNGKPLRFSEYPWKAADRHLLDVPDDFVCTCPYMHGRRFLVLPAWETKPRDEPVQMRVTRLSPGFPGALVTAP